VQPAFTPTDITEQNRVLDDASEVYAEEEITTPTDAFRESTTDVPDPNHTGEDTMLELLDARREEWREEAELNRRRSQSEVTPDEPKEPISGVRFRGSLVPLDEQEHYVA
jgi:hypothetical protein